MGEYCPKHRVDNCLECAIETQTKEIIKAINSLKAPEKSTLKEKIMTLKKQVELVIKAISKKPKWMKKVTRFDDGWHDIETVPIGEIVMLAFDTYDCGWCYDFGWKSKEGKFTSSAMVLGVTLEIHMPPSYWKSKPTPPLPNNRELY